MRKLLSLAMALLMSVGFTACSGTDKSTPAVSRDDLIGVWTVEKSDQKQIITLKADGTYLSDITADMGFTMSSQHTWSYEDGVFSVNYEDLGVTSTYSKVTLEGNVLTLDNGEGKLIYKKSE